MNNLQILNDIQKDFKIENAVKFISFDTNMEQIYISDHNKIYGIDSKNLEVNIHSLILL
jgi:hypothetical protein